MTIEHNSPLRILLEDTAEEEGIPLKDLTVLAPQNDPFRTDTPARHRDGAWLAMTARELGLGNRRIHLRGLHYMVIGRRKPNGLPYTNTEADWLWLSGDAGKAARWLDYLPFDQIVDQRNAPPVVRIFKPPELRTRLYVGIDVDIPAAEDLVPTIGVDGFTGVQPYKLVMIGEKSSLEDVLAPIADRYHADLYLPTGEPSDTMVYQMASIGAADGRPMIVLYFSDADPAGWQMPISVGRKLQAFEASHFPALTYEVHRVALTPDQVREYGLPSTPLKATEKRADGWRAEMGVEQTEIDALAALQPDLLREIARAAIVPYFDRTLERRVSAAREAWITEAQAVVDAATDSEELRRIRADAADRLAEMQEQIDQINVALDVDTSTFQLPEIIVPTAELDDGVYGLPLLDSGWDFAEQCRRLIESKAYRNGNHD